MAQTLARFSPVGTSSQVRSRDKDKSGGKRLPWQPPALTESVLSLSANPGLLQGSAPASVTALPSLHSEAEPTCKHCCLCFLTGKVDPRIRQRCGREGGPWENVVPQTEKEEETAAGL